jgi:flavin reductase (DIM6/NTAB) family NADH-FMN oxidoreductase RutF
VTDFDTETLRTVLRRFATGVAVVTTWDGDEPWGTTVNSFSSVSLRPPLVLVAFDRGRRIVPALLEAGRYAVNVLGEDQQALSDCFAGGPAPARRSAVAAAPSSASGSKRRSAADLLPARPDLPARVTVPVAGGGESGTHPGRAPRNDLCGAEWRRGMTGLPILSDAIATLECTVVDVHPAGDHDLYIARVDAATATGEDPLPLLYYSSRYLRIERASTHELEGKPER